MFVPRGLASRGHCARHAHGCATQPVHCTVQCTPSCLPCCLSHPRHPGIPGEGCQLGHCGAQQQLCARVGSCGCPLALDGKCVTSSRPSRATEQVQLSDGIWCWEGLHVIGQAGLQAATLQGSAAACPCAGRSHMHRASDATVTACLALSAVGLQATQTISITWYGLRCWQDSTL